MADKLDMKRELKHLYAPSAKHPERVEVPAMRFVMIDGTGDPNTAQEYVDAIEALYGLAYTIKFACKNGPLGSDFTVMPLEGLWWSDDMDDFLAGNKSNWQWTMMIVQPDFVTQDVFDRARAELAEKKNPAALSLARFEAYDEGLAAQIMHIGPYADEEPTIRRVHEFIDESGCERSGLHHEIYLSDPRRTAPERMKTIVRQPMRRCADR